MWHMRNGSSSTNLSQLRREALSAPSKGCTFMARFVIWRPRKKSSSRPFACPSASSFSKSSPANTMAGCTAEQSLGCQRAISHGRGLTRGLIASSCATASQV